MARFLEGPSSLEEHDMAIPYYHVDVFTGELFAGNPAGVCILSAFPADSTMQKIAVENRHSNTAFVVARADGDFDLRWFTPKVEDEAGMRPWHPPMCSRCGNTRCGRFVFTPAAAC